ncbi:hypothetical protein Tco_0954233 [Tanacetum coccineum]|uniref:Uncharacterized protein n=1 Tax=Tanacetum coccineum TaxID=301880 RepID=A0ABQ5E2E7_9ASTR
MDDLIRDRNAKLAAFQQEIDTLKETLSNNVKEKESLSQTLTVFKTDSKEKESKYIDKEIVLEKQNKELENIICKMYRSTQAMHMLTKPQVFNDDTYKQDLGYQNPFHLKKARRIQPTLYEGSVIAKEHAVISMNDDEETLILEEESRSKMLDKQNDPILIEKKIKISPIDYSKLNKTKEDFGKRFVTQKEFSVEQAFWLKHSSLSETPITSHTPVRIKAPNELPKVCLVNESLKKLKYQLANFDKVVKKRLTSDAITSGLRNVFEIQIKQLRIDNDQLLNQIMSQEIVHIVANSVDSCDVKNSSVNDCKKCLDLEIELFKKKDFIEKEAYDKLVKSYSNLEKHCISLELATQLNQEIFKGKILEVIENGATLLKSQVVEGVTIVMPITSTEDKAQRRLEVKARILSIDDLGLDWIYAHNFLTCLQRLSSYTFGHCEVSESAACLEKALFSCTSGHVEVPESASHLSSLKFSHPNTSALM